MGASFVRNHSVVTSTQIDNLSICHVVTEQHRTMQESSAAKLRERARIHSNLSAIEIRKEHR